MTHREGGLAASRQGPLVLLSLTTLYHYMYCMMVSSALSLSPVSGGALFLSARIGTALVQTLFGNRRRYIAPGLRRACAALLALGLVLGALLLAVYPAMLSTYAMWVLFAVVLMIAMRDTLGRRLVGKLVRRAISPRAGAWLMMLLEAIPLGVCAGVFFVNLSPGLAWQSLATFALGAALEGYGLWRERAQIALEEKPPQVEGGQAALIVQEMKGLGAYASYQRFHSLILMALQITLVMMYTFIGLTGEELITRLVMALVLALVLPEAISLLLAARRNVRATATQLLLVGLFLWIYGLVLFYRQLGQASSLMLDALALGLSVGGLTIATTCLAELEHQMLTVAQYGLSRSLDGYRQVRAAYRDMAVLAGQMVALVLLTLLSFPAPPPQGGGLEALAEGFRPLMIVPPLLLLVSAFVGVLHFPLNNRHFQKLRRLLTLRDEGGENPPLQKQVEEVVVQRRKGRYGVRLMIWLLRPLYYHKVVGKQNVAGYEDGRMILVCNHGEIYGPIVANLYIPLSFRPWVLSHMMDREAIVEHMYQGTMVRQRWLPEGVKKPLIRLVSPLMQWVFESLESIPVYRGSPRALMKTFRLTIEAMQAGDNILLFPENGEDHAQGEKGFVQDGVGQLYTGFAMLAPAYYAKTGKRAVFVPIYASKRLRTLTIGAGIEYNPQAPATQEKLRIVDALLASMRHMAGEDAPLEAREA